VPFNKFKQHVEPLFWFQVSVELIVGRVRLVKPAKYADDSIHALNFSTLADVLMFTISAQLRLSMVDRQSAS
jgi:hypothetical protein